MEYRLSFQEQQQLDKRLVAALRTQHDSKEQVFDTFSLFGISTFEEKAKYLQEAMYNPISFLPCDEEDYNTIYKLLLEKYLIDNWKLVELHNKLDLPQKEGSEIEDMIEQGGNP